MSWPIPLEWMPSGLPLGGSCPLCPGRHMYCQSFTRTGSCPTGQRVVSPMDRLLANEPDEPSDLERLIIGELAEIATDIAGDIRTSQRRRR